MSSYGLNDLAVAIHDTNIRNGFDELVPEKWDDPFIVPTKLALIHSEVSEALEEFRKQRRQAEFTEELADIIVRTLDLAASLDLDIEKAMFYKCEKNRQREYKHGGRKI